KKEIYQINRECLKHGAILKVIFENDFLPHNRYKVKLCKICSTVGVAFIKTSTGYGCVKQSNGDYNYRGATEEDLKRMRDYAAREVPTKAGGGVTTRGRLLRGREVGGTRVGAAAPVAMREQARDRLGVNSRRVATPRAGY